MCKVSVNVDEAVLRGMRPDLDSAAAIRLWAQEQIDLRIHQMELEDTETVDLETARQMLLASVREEYAKS
jgi:hypothetical protein